jgi:hypothetical protein
MAFLNFFRKVQYKFCLKASKWNNMHKNEHKYSFVARYEKNFRNLKEKKVGDIL